MLIVVAFIKVKEIFKFWGEIFKCLLDLNVTKVVLFFFLVVTGLYFGNTFQWAYFLSIGKLLSMILNPERAMDTALHKHVKHYLYCIWDIYFKLKSISKKWKEEKCFFSFILIFLFFYSQKQRSCGVIKT